MYGYRCSKTGTNWEKANRGKLFLRDMKGREREGVKVDRGRTSMGKKSREGKIKGASGVQVSC